MRKILLVLFLGGYVWTYASKVQLPSAPPIDDIDLNYTQDDVARVSIKLAEVENTDVSDGNANFDITISLQGLIQWRTKQENARRYFLEKVQLQPSADNPLVYYADLYDGSKRLLKRPSINDAWDKISFRVEYEVNGTVETTFNLNFYAPVIKEKPENVNLILNSTQQKNDNKLLFKFSVEPEGKPFEITELIIQQKLEGAERSNKFTKGKIGNRRYFLEGNSLEVPLETSFDLQNPEAKYFVSCDARLIGMGTKFSIKEQEITPIRNLELQLVNLDDQGLNVDLPLDKDILIINNIEVRGEGDLKIKFLDPLFQESITSKIRFDVQKQRYEIKLEGINKIAIGSSAAYYLADGSRRISPIYRMRKQLPSVSDFKFNGFVGDSLTMSFKINQSGTGTTPRVNLSVKGKSLEVEGSIFIHENEENGDASTREYIVYIHRRFPNMLTDETLPKDVILSIVLGDYSIYELTFTVFDQEKYDQKVKELQAETQQKPRFRDQKKIEKLVKEILSIGEALGNSVDDTEVSQAISELTTAKGDKVKRVFQDIGKWASIIGKIVMPFIGA